MPAVLFPIIHALLVGGEEQSSSSSSPLKSSSSSAQSSSSSSPLKSSSSSSPSSSVSVSSASSVSASSLSSSLSSSSSSPLRSSSSSSSPEKSSPSSSSPGYARCDDFVAGYGAVDTSFGGATWTNPTRITTDDNSYAQSFLTSYGWESYYLVSSYHGFAVPSEATIVGITVKVGRKCSNSAIVDATVRLTKTGSTPTGDDKAAAGIWPTTEAEAEYGSATDLWGTTWTPGDVSAVTFGVMLAARNNVLGMWDYASVDYISVEVCYLYVEGESSLSSPSSGSLTSSSSTSLSSRSTSSASSASSMVMMSSSSSSAGYTICLPLMANTGTSVGTGIAWNSPSNVDGNDGAEASTFLTTGQISQYLVSQQHEFNLPDTATVLGILAHVERRCAYGEIEDWIVRLT